MFHELVQAWFDARFAGATDAQLRAWAAVAGGRDALVAAPTGSGKTLAAFLFCLDRLVRSAAAGTLEDRTEVVYVSPLRALSNDVQKNLERPALEIAALAEERGLAIPPIRTAVRTGDTSQKERRDAVKKAPHVLVTTPESFGYVLLTSASGRRALSSVRTIVLDEIHALAGDKRGAHLALSVERLEDLVVKSGLPRPQRARPRRDRPPHRGRSALSSSAPARRCPTLVDVRPPSREISSSKSSSRKDELGAVCTHEQWTELYDRVAALVAQHRQTLVFVDTRRLSERVTHALGERLLRGERRRPPRPRSRGRVALRRRAAPQGRVSSRSASPPPRSSSASTSARSISSASSARRAPSGPRCSGSGAPGT